MDFATLHEQFSNIARRMPDKIAIEWGERTITYAALEARANQIANVLAEKVGEKKNIPIILENSIELVAVVLGCMKAGVVFVPLDPTFPDNRIKLMFEEVDAEWVITRTAWLDKLERLKEGGEKQFNLLFLDEEPFTSASEVSTFTLAAPNRHCYIYFTSGSTGKPKAILGRHRSLHQFIDWEISEFGVDESFRVSQLITPSFDAILRDIFVPFCAGGTLCIPESREVVLTARHLKEWLDAARISLTHMVPTLFKGLMAEVEDSNCLHTMRYFMLSGELLRGNDVKKFFQLFGSRIQLVNYYGATETTLIKVFHRVEASDAERVSVPVGKPMAGAQVMILNNDMQVCAPGSIGEIYIRTPFTTEGYYRNPDATRKVFLKNPFNDNPKDYIYKTGDLGMLLPDGNVEVLGRIDHQVKIRGVRIELGEIENQLLTQPAVEEAIVVAKEAADGTKYLAAYVVFRKSAAGQQTTNDLREFLRENLPEYMIPTYIIALEAMPKTPNGKTDRKALPDPAALMEEVRYTAPENETEATLLRIWSEVLEKDGLGTEHNFFELGGHSLKAANVVTKIHQAFNVDVPLKVIFQNPTVRQLAQFIAQSGESSYSPIEPVDEREYYPVSSAQRRLFVLNQLERAGVTYNMPRILTVEGVVDRDLLLKSMQALIQRHKTLRTSFTSLNGEVVQKVHDRVDFRIQYQEADSVAIPELVRDFIRPFQLEKAPLLRVGLIKESAERYVLLFDTHHIISDGTSMDLLVRDFVALYRGEKLPELPVQYVDFAVWQNGLFANGSMDKQEAYWVERFSGSIPALNLPADYPRPVTQTFDGARLRFATDRELAERLQALAKANGTTLYMVLLAAYNVLLARYSGQTDIVVGSPIAGRSHADLQNIIGMFVNTLAMRNFPRNELTFKGFLQEVKENALRAFECQDYQFEQLVNRLQISRDLSRNPLFDTMFVLHNNVHAELNLEGLKFGYYPLESAVSKFDLTLNAEEWNGIITFYLEYSTRLFKPETMERFTGHYLTILKEIAANGGVVLADIEMLLPEERETILKVFNNTRTEYPRDKTVQALIEEQVLRTPENVALVFEGHELTYDQMNTAANQLARHLQAKGVQTESVVAIMVERSLEMLIGILAILKAGGAYLPIDPDYPADRTRYVLEDSGTRLVLTQEKYVSTLSAMGVETFRIDELSTYEGGGSNLPAGGGPDSLAYMIYTSGSTGKPKGVMIEQHAVVNFITGITGLIDFQSHTSILALTTISFDIFGLETLLPLTVGLKVVIANPEQQKDTKALDLIIRKSKIDMLQMTPSRMRMLLNDDWSAPCLKDVKVLMIGGEAFPPALLGEIRNFTQAKIYNMYGPTETTIWSAVKDLTGVEEITIGQPIANTAVYILGPGDRLQPIGIPGELCIAGDGLARGYWNRPDLTDEKFAPNPFAAEPGLPVLSGRIYRTGDLARWLPDGEIAFGGRLDQQVKIRGYRIELGEIESRLIKHESVKEAVVVAREDGSGSNYLCAYVVLREAGSRKVDVQEKVGAGLEVAVSLGTPQVDKSAEILELAELKVVELKAFLARELPEYMIPNYFIPLRQIPYTPNGKIDRKALPEPDAGMITGVEYLAPGTEVEEKLVKIWEDVLGVEGIGINHNFFDIGGNSINIIKVISLISQRFGVQISMSELFLHPTIAEVARNLFMENPLKGLECVVSLNKPTEGKKNVFIIHNWSGIVYQFKEFAKALEGEYNIYGIQAKGIMKPAKLPETLEEMVTEYIVEMKTIQPEGPYIIGGYCYGNWLAYKMVEMLENRGVPVERLVMIDENAFLPDKMRKAIRVRTELQKPAKLFRSLVRLLTQHNKNPMAYWPGLEEYRQSKPQVERDYRNERTVRDNIGYMCTKGYLLKNLISTNVYVIKSEENNLVRYTPKDWQKQTSGKIWFKEIPGGHESIFAYPYLDGLVEVLRQAFEE